MHLFYLLVAASRHSGAKYSKLENNIDDSPSHYAQVIENNIDFMYD